MAAISVGRAPSAAVLGLTTLIVRSSTEAMPPLARPYCPLAAHPGFASTHLAANGQYGRASGGIASVLDRTIKVVSPNTAAQGAWPTLMAATADLPGATYVGPDGWMEWGGHPRVTRSNKLSYDETAQRRLWQLSEETVGITYP